VVSNVGSRVVGINETTRQGIAGVIQDALGTEGEALTSSDIASRIKDIGIFNDARAEVIARTELAFAFNSAALTSYKEYGVSQVQAIDGDKDEKCAERNGKVYPVAEAQDIEDHPNGTLDWVPIRDDAQAAQLRAEYAAKEAARRGEAVGLKDKPTTAETRFSQKVEQGALIDRRTGEVRSFNAGQGASASVDMTEQVRILDSMLPGERLQFALSHSHPGSTSFSVQDVLLAQRAGVGEMRAIGSDWMHVINGGPRGWPARSAISRAYAAADDAVRAAWTAQNNEFSRTVWGPFLEKYHAAKRSPEGVSAALEREFKRLIADQAAASARLLADTDHLIWTRIAEELGLNYRRLAR
jgi:hypothetical protein